MINPSQADSAQTPEVAWADFNGDPGSNRYSPLDQINADNFSDLEIAWRWDTANIGPVPEGSSVTSPLDG